MDTNLLRPNYRPVRQNVQEEGRYLVAVQDVALLSCLNEDIVPSLRYSCQLPYTDHVTDNRLEAHQCRVVISFIVLRKYIVLYKYRKM